MHHAPEPPEDPPPRLELCAEAAYEVVQVEGVVPVRRNNISKFPKIFQEATNKTSSGKWEAMERSVKVFQSIGLEQGKKDGVVDHKKGGKTRDQRILRGATTTHATTSENETILYRHEPQSRK